MEVRNMITHVWFLFEDVSFAHYYNLTCKEDPLYWGKNSDANTLRFISNSFSLYNWVLTITSSVLNLERLMAAQIY